MRRSTSVGRPAGAKHAPDPIKTDDQAVPAWLETYIKAWRERLDLERVELKVRWDRVVDGDDDIEGHVDQNQAEYARATLSFKDDLKDDEHGRKVVIHEMLHIAHMWIDQFIERVVFPLLTDSEKALAQTTYHQLVEQYVELTARQLYKWSRGVDDPRAYPNEARVMDLPSDVQRAVKQLMAQKQKEQQRTKKS